MKKLDDIEKSIDAEIDRSIKSILTSSRDTMILIKESVNEISVSNFFRILSDTDDYKKILFLHRLDLFSSGDDEIQLPYLHLCDMPKAKKTEEESKTLRQIKVSNESYFEFEFDELLQNFFGLNDKQWPIFIEKFRDVSTYFSVLSLRKNPVLLRLLEIEDFSYPFMKRIVGNYEEMDELSEIDEEEIDSVIVEMVNGIAVQTIKSIIRNIENILSKSKDIGSYLFVPLHLSARIWIDALLDMTELSFQQYLEMLDDLHRNQLIGAKSVLSWCENCSLENQLITHTIGRIAPSKLSRDKCLNCQKYKSYAAIFSFSDLFRDIMLSKDGFLAVYFGWLLETNGISYNFGTHSSKREMDFIIEDSILIECKTLRLQRDNVSFFSNIDNAISQLKKQIAELKKEGVRIKKCILLWNQCVDFNINKIKMPARHKDFISKYDFEVVGPSQIEDLIERI